MLVNGTRILVEDSGEQGAVHTIAVGGKAINVELVREVSQDPVNLLVRVGNRTLSVAVSEQGEIQAIVRLNGRPLEVSLEPSQTKPTSHEDSLARAGPVVVDAPMSGRITALKAVIGSTVEDGEALVVLEAMKMENEIAAPKRGVVREVYVQPGSLVKAGDKLVLVD
jgi:biotin carboxyl carrier protein